MKPLVSLIICTYSRPVNLQAALESILKQHLDGRFDTEILIVDNSPDGRMKSVVQSLEEAFQGRLRYLQELVQGKSRALNCGIAQAKGDILAFTDDDVIADPAWLSTLVGYLRRKDCDGVGGRVVPIYPPETPQWIRDNPEKIASGVVIYDYGEGDFRYEQKHYPFIGANYAFKRKVFDSCGLFRTDLGPGTPIVGEDTEFVERLVEDGKILYYCGQAVIRHPVDLKRTRLGPIAKWHVGLGRFAALREIEKKEKISAYYFGIPRYIWKGIVLDAAALGTNGFNRIKFLDAWRAFFRKIGMIQEYSKRRGN